MDSIETKDGILVPLEEATFAEDNEFVSVIASRLAVFSLVLASKGSAKPVPSELNISLRNSNSACVVMLAGRLWLDDGPALDFCPVVDRSLGAALGKEGAAMEPDRDLDTGIVVESDLGRPPEPPKESQFDFAL